MTTTLATPAPTCTPAAQGLCLPCLRCGAADAAVHLDLNALHDEAADAIRCGACDAEYSLAEVRRAVAQWSRVLAWVDQAPGG